MQRIDVVAHHPTPFPDGPGASLTRWRIRRFLVWWSLIGMVTGPLFLGAFIVGSWSLDNYALPAAMGIPPVVGGVIGGLAGVAQAWAARSLGIAPRGWTLATGLGWLIGTFAGFIVTFNLIACWFHVPFYCEKPNPVLVCLLLGACVGIGIGLFQDPGLGWRSGGWWLGATTLGSIIAFGVVGGLFSLMRYRPSWAPLPQLVPVHPHTIAPELLVAAGMAGGLLYGLITGSVLVWLATKWSAVTPAAEPRNGWPSTTSSTDR